MTLFKENEKKTESGRELLSHEREKERPFMIEGNVRYFGEFDLWKMREMGYEVKPILDPNKHIKSIKLVSDSNITCEICEDMTKKEKEEKGVLPGVNRVDYGDDDFRMICGQHLPDEGKSAWQNRADAGNQD
ncbi:MAG: hypothetical protein WC784_04870 [Candidatus Shapirobacteria bacterium]|jgi:hypothetical protein